MKASVVSFMALSLWLTTAGPVQSRNIKYILPIAAALEDKDAEERPEGVVKFFFGREHSPSVVKTFRSEVFDRRAGTHGKSDEKACNEAFLWALATLENRARRLGANAVINIVSFYKRAEMASATEFECRIGSFRSVVMLKGDFVTIAEDQVSSK